MPIEEFARTRVVTVAPDATVDQLVVKLRDNGVGSVIVVDDGVPLGIVTDRDLALHAADSDTSKPTAKDLMVEDLFTVQAGTGVFETIREMSEAGVRRVPIVDTDDQLVGIVTLDDLLILLTQELGNLGEVIEIESPPYPYEDPGR